MLDRREIGEGAPARPPLFFYERRGGGRQGMEARRGRRRRRGGRKGRGAPRASLVLTHASSSRPHPRVRLLSGGSVIAVTTPMQSGPRPHPVNNVSTTTTCRATAWRRTTTTRWRWWKFSSLRTNDRGEARGGRRRVHSPCRRRCPRDVPPPRPRGARRRRVVEDDDASGGGGRGGGGGGGSGGKSGGGDGGVGGGRRMRGG